jgi:hypothetical protein
MGCAQGAPESDATGAVDLAGAFRAYGTAYRLTHALCRQQDKAMRHIEQCRTAVLGGHLYRCDACGREHPVYNSCRDRHCPKCQTMTKVDWLARRQSELLPVGYFHVVFTLPHALNPLVLCNRRVLLSGLFKTVNETLQNFARDPRWRLEGQLGFLAVLHTWNQLLLDHFHLHCVVPAGVWRASTKPPGEGGRAETGQWIHTRSRYLFNLKALATSFKACFLRSLQGLRQKGTLVYAGKAAGLEEETAWKTLMNTLWKKDWIVYAKPPFAGPEQVLDYLGRYTHRVAISDHRIQAVADGEVTFTYRDRADGDRVKSKTLKADEFIRRFLLHILPKGFMKIRYYGWMAHRLKTHTIDQIRQVLGQPPPEPLPEEDPPERLLRLTGQDITRCPHCREGHLVYEKPIPRAQSPP